MYPSKLSLCIAAVIFGASSAYAQTGGADKASKRSSNRLLEEVTVTAQKREENSQDVPITIQAFSQEKLDAYGIENTADLAKITPGLTFTYTYGYTLIYLRGVGTDAFLPSADPSIATYLDGINIPQGHGKNDSIGPVERVEVLKGPQGTLFGRNSTGGAINIVTPAPPEEFVGSIKIESGRYQPDGGLGVTDEEKSSYTVYMGAPLTDTIGATVGWFEELPMYLGVNRLADGSPGPMRESYSRGGRVKLRWDISDTLNLTGTASRIKQFNMAGFSYEVTRPAPVLGASSPDETNADYVYHNDFQGGVETDSTIYGLTLEWLPGPVDIKVIFSDVDGAIPYAATDYDSGSNASVNFFTYSQYGEQNTYELQVLSNDETWMSDKLQWVAGYYRYEGASGFDRLFFNVQTGLVANVLPLSGLLNTVPILSDIIQDPSTRVTLEAGASLITESDALYAQGTWTFSPELQLTLGLRYQDETRGIENSFLDYVRTLPDAPPIEYYQGNDYSRNVRINSFSVPDVTVETLSPRIALQYYPMDALQIYGSVSRGYKSPTYNVINFFSAPDLVEKETATSVELGFKSDLADNFRLNGAVFYTEIENILTGIVSLTSGGVVRFDNAERGEISGAEFDFQWQPMPDLNPGLAITGSATYLDAVYTDYTNGAGFDEDTGLYFGPNSLVTGDNARDFSGNSIVRTPDLSYQIAFNQRVPMGNAGDLEFGLDYFYSSGYNTTPQNSQFFEQPAYDLINARVSYFYDPYGLQLTLFGNNIANEKYFATLQQNDFGTNTGLAAPRLVGVRLKWDFDTVL